MSPTRSLKTFFLIALLTLSACDSAEERAEKYYQSGMTLLEAGDVDRALVELRNVFKLNGQHKEARLTYARIQRGRGALQESYSQYLLIVEQYPDTLEARIALAEMAIDGGSWEEAARHGRAAQTAAPTEASVRAVVAALDYRDAVVAEDSVAARLPVRDQSARPGDLVPVLAHDVVADDPGTAAGDDELSDDDLLQALAFGLLVLGAAFAGWWLLRRRP